MEIIAYAAIAYLVFQFIISMVNLWSGQTLKHAEPAGNPLVSILIPARNEENNIGQLLDDLTGMKYINFEILVYDDDSTDSTSALVHAKGMADKRIQYIRGTGLLPGWLGKNHACHQLARMSKGAYMLFLDADVRVNPGLLSDSLASMGKNDLDLLSLFPVQQMKTWGEWITVPLMNRILLGNLPLLLVRQSRHPDFAAANGQFMMFKAETYKKHWFHRQVSNEKVEDIRIIRLMKISNYRVQTLLSGGQISCRMYSGFGEALNGFAKNIHAFFGNNWLILFLYVLLTTLGPFAVWATFSFQGLFIYLITVIITRIFISYLSRQSWWINTFLLPFQQVAVVLVAFLAAYKHLTGNLSWKGRKI